MHVQMHHALAGRRPDVHADIIAVGSISVIEQPTGIMDEGEEGGLLVFGCLEEGGHVPEGDEEEVAGADRVEVEPGVGEVVCEDDVGGGGVAEGAGVEMER